MALATTTLSAAVTASDDTITVASATSVAAGRYLRVDDEWMQVTTGYVSASTSVPVVRGLGGTAASAHAASANVVHGAGSDFDSPPAQGPTTLPYQRVTRVVSYSAAGAITLPNAGEDLRVVLNGTSALAMTIADPGDDIDGAQLVILSNGTAAHTLTFASGVGGEGSSYDVITQNSGGPCAYVFYACNGYWLIPVAAAMTGTVTNLTAGIA